MLHVHDLCFGFVDVVTCESSRVVGSTHRHASYHVILFEDIEGTRPFREASLAVANLEPHPHDELEDGAVHLGLTQNMLDAQWFVVAMLGYLQQRRAFEPTLLAGHQGPIAMHNHFQAVLLVKAVVDPGVVCVEPRLDERA